MRHQGTSKINPTFDKNIGYILHIQDSFDNSQGRYNLFDDEDIEDTPLLGGLGQHKKLDL